MGKYAVYGIVRASTYLGEYEAESEDAAKELAWADAYISVCCQCSDSISDPEIDELQVQPA